MKLISTTKVVLQHDRQGVLEEFVQIEVTIDEINQDEKFYRIKAVDSIVCNRDTENEVTMPLFDRNGIKVERIYIRTYEEYDAERAALKIAYPTTLTGSERSDFLLGKGALIQLQNDPIYGVEFEVR